MVVAGGPEAQAPTPQYVEASPRLRGPLPGARTTVDSGEGLSGWGPGPGNEALGLEWKAPCRSHWLPPGGAAPRWLLPKPPPRRRWAPVGEVR